MGAEIQECEHPEDVEDLTSDSFKKFVEDYFSAVGGTVDHTVLLKQLQERTGVDLATKGLGHQDFDRLLHATSVEIFPVQVPMLKDKNFDGVSVYCDDKGIAKCLEENPRMSGLIQACGYHQQTFRGDCFIGRIFDDTEDVWRRVDFSLQDVNSDAEWVQTVRKTRDNRSVGDMTSFAKTVGAQNPAHITAADVAKEDKGETDQYAWRQAGDEVEITFKKDGLVKGDKKAVKVTFGRQKLKVEAKGDVLIDEELYASTDCDEATWTLSDGVLQVTLTKEEAGNWPRLMKNA